MLGLGLIEIDGLSDVLTDGLKLIDGLIDGESDILSDGLRLILGDKLGDASPGFSTSNASICAIQRTFLGLLPSSCFT